MKVEQPGLSQTLWASHQAWGVTGKHIRNPERPPEAPAHRLSHSVSLPCVSPEQSSTHSACRGPLSLQKCTCPESPSCMTRIRDEQLNVHPNLKGDACDVKTPDFTIPSPLGQPPRQLKTRSFSATGGAHLLSLKAPRKDPAGHR